MATGRPREFDADAALDRAMAVFWHRGYEGATLPELTAAMGINRPSLYAAFGNKEALFRKALERYTTGPAGYVVRAMERPTAREAVEALFAGSITMLTDPHNPGGCLVLNGSLACGEASEGVRKELCGVRAAGTDLIRQRLKRAKHEGELPADTDCADLARFVSAVTYGLGVLAGGGATRTQLQRVAAVAMTAWPE